jgi:hypothetical protein
MHSKSPVENGGAFPQSEILQPTPNFAEWRPRPPRPPKLSTRIKRLPWDGYASVVVFLAIVCLLLWIGIKMHVPFFVLPYVAFGWLGFVSEFLKAPESVKEMMDFPQVVPQYPVHVSIFSEGVKVGWDVGVATISEDLLHFEGRRTSFGLTRSDASLALFPNYKSAKALLLASISWSCRNKHGKLEILPYGRVSGSKKGYGRDFRAALLQWESCKSPAKVHTILPPRYPSQTEIRKAESRRSVTFWIACALPVLTICLCRFLLFGGFGYLWLIVGFALVEIVLVKYIFKPQKERVILLESAHDEERTRNSTKIDRSP